MLFDQNLSLNLSGYPWFSSYIFTNFVPTKMSKAVVLLAFCFFPFIDGGGIRQVIYDFDETISSQHVFTELRHFEGSGDRISMHEQVAVLDKCSLKRVQEMFGGSNRLRALQEHWESLKSHGIDIAIISSFSYREVIVMALDKVGLMQYFSADKILGQESSFQPEPGVSPNSVKTTLIERHFNQFPAEQRLFIDDDRRNMNDVSVKGVAKTMESQGPIYKGLTEPQLLWIKDQCSS